jgi:putative transposase
VGTKTRCYRAGLFIFSGRYTYKRHRFPAEIISHCVWLYFRFCLSYRDVEELMAERGVILTYEAVRSWCRKFGQTYANQVRRRRPQPGRQVASG